MVGVQIYCRRPSLGETMALLEMGVTHIAWDLLPQDGDRMVLSSQLVEAVSKAGAKSALLIHSRKSSVLSIISKMVRPDYLLLSSERDDAEMPNLAKEVEPQTRLMMSVPVRPNGSTSSIPSMQFAQGYADYAGALTLDTCVDPNQTTRFGCTGKTNDWTICSSIVGQVSTPIVLAGGLTPENVAAAIKAVNPAIVDACTSLELADKSKDLRRCRAFVEAAIEASR